MARVRPPRTRGVAPRKTDWLTTLAVIVPLALLAILLSPFFALAAGVVMLLGVTLLTVGIKRTVVAYQSKGLRDFNDTMPFFLRGGLLLLISQIYHVCKFPRVLGLWFFLEMFGIVLLVASFIIIDVVKPPLYPGEKPAAVAGQPPGVPGQPGGAPQPAPEVPRVTGDPEIDRALADVMDQRDVSKHHWGAARLAELKPNAPGRDPAIRPVVAAKLAELAVSDSPFGRGEAVQALQLWATPNEIPALMRCFREGGLRDRAGKALRTVGPAAEKEVLALVTDQDIGIRETAIDVLKDIGTEQSLPMLQMIADGNDGFTRRRAQDAVKAIKARARK
jgi:hypothetical protein